MQDRSNRLIRNIAGGGIVFLALFPWFFIQAQPAAEKPASQEATEPKKEVAEKSKSPDDFELMKEFATAYQQIVQNHVKEVDRRELLEAAINGMVSKLDRYSGYISPKDLEQFTRSVEQKFGGLGVRVRIDKKTNRLTITTPLPGTPAHKAGIRTDDIIEEIEGKSTVGYTVEKAQQKLKGKLGEEITLGIRRNNAKEILQIKIVRSMISLATILGEAYNPDGTWDFMYDKKQKIGYIRLTNFSRNTAAELKVALKQLKKAGMKSLMLDLRFNGGGLLSQATKIADLFIDKGRIVSTKGRSTPERVWDATKPNSYTDFPLVVLVNRLSASASEILSACLQDHKRAIIVGERTWGKGSVQNVIQLNGGISVLKLTTASYHRPSGKNIHRFPDSKISDAWGVTPNKGYLIKFTQDEILKCQFDRLTRDIITRNGAPKRTFKDRQIEKSIAYLIEQTKQAKKPKNAVSTPANNTVK